MYDMYEEQRRLADKITEFRTSDRPDEAIALCQQAISQFPDNSFFPKLEGDICRQYKRFSQAARAYLKMLVLLRPEKFSIFVTAYRNLEKNAPKEVMSAFLDDIKRLLNSASLSEELRKNLQIFLGSQLVVDHAFLRLADQADNDDNLDCIKSKIDEWEAAQDITKIEALAKLKLDKKNSSKSKKIDTLLIYRLEKCEKYDLALAMIEKTQKPYQNRLILTAMLRICRKKEDYAFAEKELDIDEGFIDTSDFNLQYELVYYFRAKDDDEGLEKTLRRMRDNSATSSIPIARTLYNFYLSLDRFEDAQGIYEHIQYLEKERAIGLEQRRKGRTRLPIYRNEEQMESEQALRQRMKELVSEKEHNRQMIALRDLLKGFSHELGQPITNIRYAVQLYQKKIQRGLDTSEALQIVLTDILRQTDRIGTLLSRFGPIVSPKDETGEFSIRTCAEKVFDDLKTRMYGQNIIYQIDGPADLTLSGDQVQFSQVFYNLALNAMQAIEKNGHITIDITGSTDGVLTILFADNGPGIPEEDRQKVFEPFFSTKDPTSGNGGEGLGLYIVWNILKIFNGTIQIDKSFRSGTRFIMKIQQQKGGESR
ncbi:MAG: HAMP domain-containing histidine kinase [Lachnospiraceae bacterium]|nr:HAMP domain-containing histidine kinase [Lachnospiraceae bacterium]